jgi:hypothetical protein
MTQAQEIAVKVLRAEPLATIEEIAMIAGVTRVHADRIAKQNGFDAETRAAAREERLRYIAKFVCA